ncbi:unnamed protein product, partial [marine sediment metagenome]
HEDTIYLWFEINKIKNLKFKLNEIPESLENWDEIEELVTFIKSLNEVFLSKKKKDKKERILTFHFDEINQFFQSKNENKIKFYADLIYLLYSNNYFEEYHGEEFINILERKEVIQNLTNFIQPLFKQLIEDKLHDILVEIDEFELKEKDLNINLKNLQEHKISVFLPKIVDYYIVGVEKRF